MFLNFKFLYPLLFLFLFYLILPLLCLCLLFLLPSHLTLLLFKLLIHKSLKSFRLSILPVKIIHSRFDLLSQLLDLILIHLLCVWPVEVFERYRMELRICLSIFTWFYHLSLCIRVCMEKAVCIVSIFFFLTLI
jgi:hypothetical protein